jgi:hypothetical protein
MNVHVQQMSELKKKIFIEVLCKYYVERTNRLRKCIVSVAVGI